MRGWIGWLVLGGCTGTEPEELAPDAVFVDYSVAGPASVGTQELEIPGPEGLLLKAQVWYPSDDAQGAGVSYDGLLQGEATLGLSPSCPVPRPAVVFSHGLGGVRWQSPFFVEFLASHGFFVVAVDHPGSGLFDTDYSQLAPVILRRPAEMAAAFDGIVEAFPDCVDAAQGYAATGHSFGGYTAFAAAGARVQDPTAAGADVDLGDQRVWAVVALAPWDAEAITDGTSEVDVPVMVLTGRQDQTTPLAQVRRLWNPLGVTPRVFGVGDTAGHYSFSPVACLLEEGDGCGAEFMEASVVSKWVNQSSAAFLSSQRGEPSADSQWTPEDPLIDWTVD